MPSSCRTVNDIVTVSTLALWIACTGTVEASQSMRISSILSSTPPRDMAPFQNRRADAVMIPRGGETSQASKPFASKKKKKKKKKSSGSEKRIRSDKKVIQEAMREKDAAKSLGDAIRDRADVLKADSENPLLQKIDSSVSSVGYAMGSSDARESELLLSPEQDGGGVEAAPTSVLANYFLKSHGGAHAVQCVCSLLAFLCATGTVMTPSSKSDLRLTLIKRAMLFAMTKHMSGLLAATSIAATAIPEVGLRQARKWVEKLAKDPVSQYVFYAALVLLWLPSGGPKVATSIPWWYTSPLTGGLAPLALVGPVLLREAVSTAFVCSDILVLLSTSAGQEVVPRLLQVSTSFVNAGMSVLVTPKTWRGTDSETRQAMLAKLTSRMSLTLELYVGMLIAMDGLMSVWEFSFLPSHDRPVPLVVIKRLLCARLYLNFLWVRRRRIVKLAGTLRGGTAELPFRVINVLLDPKAAMGLESKDESTNTSKDRILTWKDYAILGFAESSS